MDELDRMFRRLVDVVRADYPSLIDRPIEVGELYQSVLPYRHHRRALGFETNQDYELTMMRLLSGERGYVSGDARMQERLRQEFQSSNPDSALFRAFATTTITLDPEAVRRATAGDASLAAAPRGEQPAAASPSASLPAPSAPPPFVAPGARPVADQPVAQRVADDRAPERPRPAAAPVSSPDAETIVFRRTPTPASMPPASASPPPPPMASAAPPPPPAPFASAAPPPPPSAPSAPAAPVLASAATERPTEPIVLRSNEKITIRPSGEVESSLGRPASESAGAAPPAVAPPSSAAAPTPMPSVGPPPRPRGQQSFGSESGTPAAAPETAPAGTDRGGIRAGASTPPSPRSPMATPQRGANTIVASGDCRYCGGALPDGRRITFCPHCGQNLTIQHCPACSSELELGWKFCTTCGRAVGDQAATAARA